MMHVLLLVRFSLLAKGADFLVRGSSSVTKLPRVLMVIIGLTIVAFGTSTPELVVSTSASSSGSNDIVAGNIIDSNTSNLLMVVGTCGVIMPMVIDKMALYGDYLFLILAAAVMPALFAFSYTLSCLDGVILLLLFAYFLYKMVRDTLASRAAGGPEGGDAEVLSPVKSVLFILGGLAAIVVGGNMVVNSASPTVSSFGLSGTPTGLTVVVFRTPLPELVTSVVTSRKGEDGLALGNVIGSSLFNTLSVLAAFAIISPMKVDILSTYDAIFLIAASIITWFLAKSRSEVNRREGIIMVLMHVGYAAYIIMR